MPNPHTFAILIKQLAQESGFEACGISKAERLIDDEKRLEQWLGDRMHVHG